MLSLFRSVSLHSVCIDAGPAQCVHDLFDFFDGFPASAADPVFTDLRCGVEADDIQLQSDYHNAVGHSGSDYRLLVGGIPLFLLILFCVAVTTLIWYPFFKMADNQALKEEAAAAD